MTQFRRISSVCRSIKDKYFITEDGTVYVEVFNRRVMKCGEQRYILSHILKEAKRGLESFFVPFPDWGNYCVILRDETVLRRLGTSLDRRTGVVRVHLIDVCDKQLCIPVARLVANVFISDVNGYEVHHIDKNRLNNHVSNLEILTFEEHRGKNSSKH